MKQRIGKAVVLAVMKFICLALLASILAACGSGRAVTPTPTPGEGVTFIDPPVDLQNFTLTSAQNTPLSLSDLKGKLSVFTFGYTHCPDVCPINLANFKLVKKELGSDADKVNFVFVSVDGKRDTPAVLAKHLQIFDQTFIGLTGDDAAIAPVAKAFYVSYVINPPDSSGDYTVMHTASWFLVDAEGRLRRVYGYGTSPQVITDDLEELLSGSS